MKRLLAIMAMAFAAVQFDAFAEPTVSDVVAKQRFPWNGLVDITCNVSGMDDTTKLQEFAVAAVMPESGEVWGVSHFWVMRDGVKSTDYKVNADGSYQLLWDAKADLGEIVCDNIVMRIMVVDFHEKVQLWENGPYWATTNIGAEEPWEFGYYFWWGDTIGYKRENDVWVATDGSSSNFQFENDPISRQTFNKFYDALCSEGWITSDDVLAPEHDAAHVQWGSDWRMPTFEEICDLDIYKCDWILTTTNGVNGYIVRGKGDYASNSIFLPCAGYGHGTSLNDAGSYGYYWSSVTDGGPSNSMGFYFTSGGYYNWCNRTRYVGLPVRSVQGFTNSAGFSLEAGYSSPFLLDTRIGRNIDSLITVQWDVSWIGGDAVAMVVIKDNGVIVTNATGVGEVEYAPTGVGRHELTYTTYINDAAQAEVYRAFVYKGKYMIRFDANGGEGEMDDCELGVDMPFILPECEFTRDGYFLLGWALTPDGEATLLDRDSTADIVADEGEKVTLYAVWHEYNWNVAKGVECSTGGDASWYVQTSDTHDGIAAVRSGEIGDHQSTWLETTVTGNGKFSFWWKVSSEDCLSFDVDGNGKYSICGETSWEQKSYEVSGEGEHTLRWTYYKDGIYDAGYDCGWVGEITWSTSDKVHRWVPDSNPPQLFYFGPYAVRFDANGGEGTMPKRVYAIGDDVMLPENGAFTRDDWILAGWSTEPEGSVIYSAEGSIDGGVEAANEQTVTLYARWAQNQYAVHFDANGGVGTIADQLIWIGLTDRLSSNTFTRAGYTFAGWALSSDGDVLYDDAELVANLGAIEGDGITLYAVWSPNEYCVRFNANGGDGFMEDQTLTYDVAASLTSNTFTKVGYTFAGWATEEDGEVVYDDGDEVLNLASEENAIVNLYAVMVKWVIRLGEGSIDIEIENDGAILDASASPPSGDVIIPAECMGYPVVGIGDKAFAGCGGIISITIPETIVNISEGAFDDCEGLVAFNVDEDNINYKSVDGLLLSKDGSTLIRGVNGDITVPNSVTTISDNAFSGYKGLTSIVIPYGVASIGNNAFKDCNNVRSVTVPGWQCNIPFENVTNLVVSAGSTYILNNAFSGCGSLISVTIPDRVTSIGDNAFSGCGNITSVTMPGSHLTSILQMFPDAYEKITSIVLSGNTTSISENAFAGCMSLTAVNFPDDVVNIGANAFSNCGSLTSVTIPDSVTNIGDDAFSGCDNITSVIIPSSQLTSILQMFPDAYEKITSVVLTGNATSIPENAFAGCLSLRSIVFPDSVVNIGNGAFDGCNIECSEDGYKIVNGWLIGFADDARSSISEIDSIRGVADGALEGCRALEDLTFTQNSVLKTIGKEAFKGCTELRTMTLPPSLEEIGYEAFMGCSYLGNVIVPGNVKRVGDRAFKNCTGFTAAQIEYGVESLGEEVFYGDWRISEVDIPSTVTNIGVNAFGGDSSIIRIGLRGDIRYASDIFSNYSNIREATVKAGDGEIVNGLFSGFKDLRSVHFLGNCPRLENDGEWIYYGTPGNSENESGLITYVGADSTGWDGTPGSHSLPQAWPLVGGYRRSIAVWDAPTYLCQFDSNGGTLGIQDTYQYSEKRFVLPPEPVQTGYSFAGWWTQPVGGLRVTADTIFIEGVYTHIYAHWIKGHWVFLDPNGGTVVNDFVTYVEQSVYGVLPTPVRSGYAFGGWFYDDTRIEPETEINEKADHTLVAQWTANLYSVRYNANGGDGDMAEQGFVYGVEQELRKNVFARAGYDFIGWATNAVDAVGLEEETDAVVYADCESVTNLTAVADGWIELFAVWKESDVLPDPSNLDFHFSGDAKWELRYEGVAVEKDGETLRYATVWRSGSIANNQKSVLVANVYGAGKIGFWWKVSCESFRDWKLDNLEFAIDGVAQEPWINGEKDWAYVEFEVETSGAHTLTWAYSKDEEGSDGEDCGWITAAVWTPKLESLGDYVNCPTLEFSSSGNSKWQGDKAISHDGIASLRSGVIGDGEVSTLETEVEGAGRIGFWWKVSSEAYRTFKIDYVSFSIDDVEQAWMGGEIGWTNVAFDVVGSGTHTLRWEYRKDDWEDTKSGEDCAWLDEVVWTPKSAVPTVEIDGEKMEAAVVDEESGNRVIAAKEGQTLTEEDVASVTISSPLDSSDITEAYVKTLVDNQIIIELATPAVESVEEEDKDENDPSGMLANVEPEQIQEQPDPKEGEEVGALPIKTYPGLYYQASWGDDLGDMTTGGKVQATGETLYLGVIKQKGDKGFYKLSVSEE